MNSLLPQDGAPLGGVERVFFVEHRHVARWPLVVAGQLLTAHQLVPGARFAQLVGEIYTPSLDVEAADSPHGPSFAHSVAGVYASPAPADAARLAAMTGRRYLVLVRYFDGSVAALGDALAGLLFSSKLASGKLLKDRKAHAWKFEGPTGAPAALLSHAFEVEGLGLVTPGQPVADAPTGSGAPVQVFNSRGQLLATVQPGRTIHVTSAFKVKIRVS